MVKSGSSVLSPSLWTLAESAPPYEFPQQPEFPWRALRVTRNRLAADAAIHYQCPNPVSCDSPSKCLSAQQTAESPHQRLGRTARGDHRGAVDRAGHTNHITIHAGLEGLPGNIVDVADEKIRYLPYSGIGTFGGAQHMGGGNARAQGGDRHPYAERRQKCQCQNK